jgi:hypothetical protein
MKMHPIFHISLLEPANKDTIYITPRLDIEVYEEEFEPERIIDRKRIDGENKYLIKWKGYTNADNTWEPARHLKNSPQLLRKFHEATRHKKNPPSGQVPKEDHQNTQTNRGRSQEG